MALPLFPLLDRSPGVSPWLSTGDSGNYSVASDVYDGRMDAVRFVTRLSDGSEVVAVPTYDEESRARAVGLGYPDVSDYFSVDAMNRDHDAVHQALARVLGLPDSPTLRMVADGKYPEWASLGDLEERIVFAFQSMLNGKDVLGAVRAEMERSS